MWMLFLPVSCNGQLLRMQQARDRWRLRRHAAGICSRPESYSAYNMSAKTSDMNSTSSRYTGFPVTGGLFCLAVLLAALTREIDYTYYTTTCMTSAQSSTPARVSPRARHLQLWMLISISSSFCSRASEVAMLETLRTCTPNRARKIAKVVVRVRRPQWPALPQKEIVAVGMISKLRHRCV